MFFYRNVQACHIRPNSNIFFSSVFYTSSVQMENVYVLCVILKHLDEMCKMNIESPQRARQDSLVCYRLLLPPAAI